MNQEEEIIMEHKNAWRTYSDEQVKELEALCGRYKAFLDAGKTERECVKAVSYTHLTLPTIA